MFATQSTSKLPSVRGASSGTHQNPKRDNLFFSISHHFGSQITILLLGDGSDDTIIDLFRNVDGLQHDDGIFVETVSSTPWNCSHWSLCCIYFIDIHNIGKAWPGIFFKKSPSKLILHTKIKAYNRVLLYSK